LFIFQEQIAKSVGIAVDAVKIKLLNLVDQALDSTLKVKLKSAKEKTIRNKNKQQNSMITTRKKQYCFYLLQVVFFMLVC